MPTGEKLGQMSSVLQVEVFPPKIDPMIDRVSGSSDRDNVSSVLAFQLICTNFRRLFDIYDKIANNKNRCLVCLMIKDPKCRWFKALPMVDRN